VCDEADFETILDLGNQPWGNGFIETKNIQFEKSYPLRLIYCNECSTAQLDFTLSKEEMFVSHTYLSGTTTTLRKHFETTAIYVYSQFLSQLASPKVLDIGSNDGTQLEVYKNLGCEVLGVESAIFVSEIANKNQIKTLNAFFNLELAKSLNTKFHIINASGVFFHLEELHSVCEGIRITLEPQGVFVVQFIYMKLMQDNTAFDQIYHEHLLYYTLKTINTLLRQHNLEMFDAEISNIHGGTIIGYIGHPGNRPLSNRLRNLVMEEEKSGANTVERYREFASKTHAVKQKTLNWVNNSLTHGKTIFGLGAPVKGNTLLNFFDLGPDKIKYLTERNTLRRGLVSPGKHIPIIMDDELPEKPDSYLVLAWNFKEEILKRHQDDVQNGIEFYFPVEPGEDK
jgi:2-polyprenyl-3-methyl-5-hydroxy-6-metoxy-1,4-benzoquinol methylase